MIKPYKFIELKPDRANTGTVERTFYQEYERFDVGKRENGVFVPSPQHRDIIDILLASHSSQVMSVEERITFYIASAFEAAGAILFYGSSGPDLLIRYAVNRDKKKHVTSRSSCSVRIERDDYLDPAFLNFSFRNVIAQPIEKNQKISNRLDEVTGHWSIGLPLPERHSLDPSLNID